MIINSVPATSTTARKLIIQSINVKIIKYIVHWQAKPLEQHSHIGTNCHCLVRIYDFEAENRAVVIASSLWSNDGNYDIWETYADLVTPTINLHPELTARLPNVDWIAHSGQFSYPLSWSETCHRDSFDIIPISFNERNQAEISGEEVPISIEQVEKLINFSPIEPAVKVLKQLEHDNGWGGVVDEWQVKACWELENGIVLEQIRETGLVGW